VEVYISCHKQMTFCYWCMVLQLKFYAFEKCRNKAYLPLTWNIKKLEGFHLQPSDQGLCPWAPLGTEPPDPLYRLALCALAIEPLSPILRLFPRSSTGASPLHPTGGLSFHRLLWVGIALTSLVCITNTTLPVVIRTCMFLQWILRRLLQSIVVAFCWH